MTFKEFKIKKKLNPTSGFCLSYDWDIFCDMAEAAGYDPYDDRMYNHYGDHETYMNEYGFNLWYENINIADEDLVRLEQFTNYAFDREYFFDKYEVADSYNDDEYGFIVKLVHC